MATSIRLATREDNPAIVRLVNRIYQNGLIRLGFQRNPDFFIGQGVIGDEHVLTVIVDDEKPNELAGLTNMAGRDLYISGQRRRVWYSGDTRVDFPYRRRGLAEEMFKVQKQYRSTTELLQGIVLKDNTAPLDAARNTAEGVLFDYWISHDIETSFIFTRKIKPRIPAGVELRRASAADVPAMQAFFDAEAPRRNGYPCYDFAAMLKGDPYYAGIKIDKYILALRGGKIIGITGSWDQKGFKQTAVLGYKPALAALRPLVNLWFGLVGGMQLPPPGGMLNYLTLHTVLIANDDQDVFRALIDWIMANDGQKVDALSVALTEGDPLIAVPRTYKRQKLISCHFWLSYGDDPRPGIDNRPLYVELGRL